MITAKLGDYFHWMGQIVKVEWMNLGQKAIGFKFKRKVDCPHCKHEFEIDDGQEVIEASPQFQENAIPIQTLEGEPVKRANII